MSIKWNPNSLVWHLRSSAIYPYSANNFTNQRSPSAEAFSDVIFGLALSLLHLNIFFVHWSILITHLKWEPHSPSSLLSFFFSLYLSSSNRPYNLPTYYIYFLFYPEHMLSEKTKVCACSVLHNNTSVWNSAVPP